jgi:hypothetical protein
MAEEPTKRAARDVEFADVDGGDMAAHHVTEKSLGVQRIEAIVSTFNTTDRVLLYSGLALSGCKSALL